MALEAGQLPVATGLKNKAHEPNQCTCDMPKPNGPRRSQAKDQRNGPQPDDDPLQQKDLEVAPPPKAIARTLAPTGIPRVFAMGQVAPKNVEGIAAKAQSAHGQ